MFNIIFMITLLFIKVVDFEYKSLIIVFLSVYIFFFLPKFLFLLLSVNSIQIPFLYKSINKLLIIFSLFTFNSEEFLQEDLVNEYSIYILVILIPVLLSRHRITNILSLEYNDYFFETDIMFRYLLIIFLRRYFESQCYIIIIQCIIYRLSFFNEKTIGNHVFLFLQLLFGLIPALIVKFTILLVNYKMNILDIL